ncbi:anaerobic sulfite reductase subunit AsrA [Anaerotignum sp. MB30-C6]|nr:anaerobic sulfite reductase subunit AsrA [Anaerotignum sp. MB30-C6]WMI82711.1 anaerobic sulfite reductase subunit AsrA [Anaerotignum sp. MB30-C6]
MGYVLTTKQANEIFAELSTQYRLFAPKTFGNEGRYSDTGCVRYGEVTCVEDITFDKKSEYSFKEAILPVMQTLFYFTEREVTEPKVDDKKTMIFLRSCDIHAVKRLDEMYYKNGPKDYYYSLLRDNVKFVLIGCEQSFENCFCVSMGTNTTDHYDFSFCKAHDTYEINLKNTEFISLFEKVNASVMEVKVPFVTENDVKVQIPDGLKAKVTSSTIWDEYDSRCIACGRCNFVCPTCTCFTMQDMYYTDNGKVGERRRVWASCMVDGFTDVAGGGSYRKNYGQRMRFKLLHKVYDFKQRNGFHMCIGCGRCDDVCPEYISFSNCINKLPEALKEVDQL